MQQSLNILVVGATGGSGRATAARLRKLGHRVTAFARSADRLTAEVDGILPVNGDVTDPATVERAVSGQDVVIITLGITENPLRVRLLGPARTPLDVRSRGTRNVIAAMGKSKIRRLIVLSSYGVGETRERLGWLERLIFALLLKPQMQDTELQERLVRAADLEWTLVQPVHLTDAADASPPFVSASGTIRSKQVTRDSLALVLAQAASGRDCIGRSIAVSGHG